MDTFYNPSTGEFVPERILDWCGVTRHPARLKKSAMDFQVCEENRNGIRFSISPQSDFHGIDGCTTLGASGQTRFTRVTMIKWGLTTGHVESLVRKMFRDQGHDVRVTYAGNKDRTAVTAQEFVIEGAPFDVVARACRPYELNGRGWFMKDPMPTDGPLSLGRLNGNWFKVRLEVPGVSAGELNAHLNRVRAFMADRNWLFPNVIFNQRRGRCQINDLLGYAFLQAGPEEAFRLALTMGAPDESQFAKSVRQALAEEWKRYEELRDSGASLDDQFFPFVQMHQILTYGPDQMRWGEPVREPVHIKVNMPIEFGIVNLAAKMRSFDEVARRLKREFSLWIGAIQGYWFNRALDRVLSGQLQLKEGEETVPLLVNRPRALRFYREHFPEALPGRYDQRRECLTGLHPLVNRLYFSPNSAGPERPLFSRCSNFRFTVADEEVFIENKLPSGTFETTLLSFFFNLDSNAQGDGSGQIVESDE